jgi:thiamine kinase-like enzyme
LDDHLSICAQHSVLSSEDRSAYCRFFADAEPLLSSVSSHLLHGDPGNHNVLVDGDTVRALIDWEDALAGDPIYELAFWTTFHPARRHTLLWRSYFCSEDLDALPRSVWQRFWLYYVRIALAKTVVRFRFGYQDRPGRAKAADRIPGGMARLRAVMEGSS